MLNAADILILAALALSVLVGFWRGLVGEVLALATWVAAFWIAWVLGPRLATFYGQWLHEPAASVAAGYVSCFLGVLVIGAILAWATRRALGAGGLRGGDHALGALFGLARGVLVVMLAVVALGMVAEPRESRWWQTSVLLPPFESGARWLTTRFPPAWDHGLERARARLPSAVLAPTSALHAAGRRASVPAVGGDGARRAAGPRVDPRNDVGQ